MIIACYHGTKAAAADCIIHGIAVMNVSAHLPLGDVVIILKL